jgi:hypothetical protein
MTRQSIQPTMDPIALVAALNANFNELYTGSGAGPAWVKVGALAAAAFAAAALSNAVNLFQLAPGQIIHAVKLKHTEAFAGGSIASYTVSVGVSGTAAKYASAFDVHQAVSSTAFQLSTTVGAEDNSSATQIIATATSTGANLNAATAGVVHIWALLSTVPAV